MKNRLIAVVFTAVIFIGSITAWCTSEDARIQFSKTDSRKIYKGI